MEYVFCKLLPQRGSVHCQCLLVLPSVRTLSLFFQAIGSQSTIYRSTPSENGSSLLSRWLSSHYHGGVHDEKSVARHTVNLLTSTIKVDADQSDLRFCFRIISPTKVYTLQVQLQTSV